MLQTADGDFNSSPATVRVRVEPVNDAPEAEDQNVTLPEQLTYMYVGLVGQS